MTLIEKLKWFSSVVLVIGIILTSYNIYPANLYVQVVGVLGWLLTGILTRDNPLIFINSIGFVVLVSGMYYSWKNIGG
jgi:uncharacterized protein with PQ loop repeat